MRSNFARQSVLDITHADHRLDDANLSELIGSCNPGSAILMEDMWVSAARSRLSCGIRADKAGGMHRDCAFASRSAVEQEDDVEASTAAVTVQRPAMSASGVTLSGLRESRVVVG
jgi:hypothetical protein